MKKFFVSLLIVTILTTSIAWAEDPVVTIAKNFCKAIDSNLDGKDFSQATKYCTTDIITYGGACGNYNGSVSAHRACKWIWETYPEGEVIPGKINTRNDGTKFFRILNNNGKYTVLVELIHSRGGWKISELGGNHGCWLDGK